MRRWFMSAGRQQRLERPVVSVGNLAAGGRGKTPMVEYIVGVLIDAGERPAILSRGYGRPDPPPGAVVVSDGTGVRVGADLAGDEPLMMARALPGAVVVVGDDRRVAGALAECHLGATVHVLDDGFQHLQLARDIDLVLVAPEDLGARAFPFGPLRESPRALAAADAVLVDGDVTDASAWSRSPALRFRIRRSLSAPVHDGRTWAPSFGPVVALAGIARPHRFTDDLAAAGWTVAESVTFPDHHRYGPRDLTRVQAAVERSGAAGVVTTAKDAARLPVALGWTVPLAVATLHASVDPAEPFRTWLLGRLAEARA